MEKSLTAKCRTAENRLTATRKSNDTVNLMIKRTLAETGMYRWQLADLLGCSVETVQRRLRHELPESEQRRICEMIRSAADHE